MEQKEMKIDPNSTGETHKETFQELREPMNVVLKMYTSVFYEWTLIRIIVIC